MTSPAAVRYTAAGEVLRYLAFNVRLPPLPDEGTLFTKATAEGVGVDVRDGHA